MEKQSVHENDSIEQKHKDELGEDIEPQRGTKKPQEECSSEKQPS
jgi:hypothetical protein